MQNAVKSKFLSSNRFLISLIIFENLFLYYFYKKGFLPQGKNAIGLFLSSLLFGIAVIYRFYNSTVSENTNKITNNRNLFPTLFFLGGLLFLGVEFSAAIKNFPIDPQYSDVIPLIVTMSKRFVSGQNPYGIVNFFGIPGTPNYLPAHWAPFTIAEFFRFDYRFIAFGTWAIASFILFIRALKMNNQPNKYFALTLILLSNYVLLQYNKEIVGVTVELMIAGYYMMLMSGMNLKNGVMQGIFISLCLLSRYTLIVWLPLYAFVLFFSGNKKLLLHSIVTVAVIAVIVYVIPVLSRNWVAMTQNFSAYSNAAVFEWSRHNFEGKPCQLFSGTGFAFYVYTRFPNLELPQRVALLQKVFFSGTIGITIIMGAWYWFNRTKIDYRIFLMGSFKIYIAVFLFFIQVPYEYLMCVGNFVSVAIFCEQMRYAIPYKNVIGNDTPSQYPPLGS